MTTYQPGNLNWVYLKADLEVRVNGQLITDMATGDAKVPVIPGALKTLGVGNSKTFRLADGRYQHRKCTNIRINPGDRVVVNFSNQVLLDPEYASIAEFPNLVIGYTEPEQRSGLDPLPDDGLVVTAVV